MGFILLIPFFLIRFGLLSILNRDAVMRAAYFAPLLKQEKLAYWVYQMSTAAIFLYMFFLKIKFTPPRLFYVGLTFYSAGILLLTVSIIHFATPSANGINQNGIYGFSRNPMYVAYFVLFFGCAILTQSFLLLAFVLAFQISAHWIIRSEERWCLQRFGGAYRKYMKEVRRYL